MTKPLCTETEYHHNVTMTVQQCKESMEKLMDELIPNDVTPKVFSDSLITDMTKVNVTAALKIASKFFNCKVNLFYKSESGYDFGEIVNHYIFYWKITQENIVLFYRF